MCTPKTNFPRKRPILRSSAGFSLLELLITIVLVGVVSSFAVIAFQKSNRSFNLTGATRTLSSYLEKARVDSVRRHGGTSILINSTSSYTVSIDFGGIGTNTDRTINLPTGTSLSYSLPPDTTSINPSDTPITIAYDWRGRTATAVSLTLTDSTSGVASSTVVIGSAGDVSADSTANGPVTTPTPQNTTVTTTTGIKSMR